MSHDSDGGFYAASGNADSGGSEKGDACGESVLAAIRAISTHCDTDGVPMQMSDGMVAMVPQEEMDRVQNAAPGEMSDEQLREFMEQSPWLREWSRSLCEKAGLEEGSESFEDCLLSYARDALAE